MGIINGEFKRGFLWGFVRDFEGDFYWEFLYGDFSWGF